MKKNPLPPRPKYYDSPVLPKIMKYMGIAHVWLYKRTGGILGKKYRVGAAALKPAPVLLLEHRGRKSGVSYTAPLGYVQDGATIVIAASMGGLPNHPQWYHNLRVDPDTYIQIGRRRHPVRAVVADPEQRTRLRPRIADAFINFKHYERWAGREIPFVLLQPRESKAT